MEATDNVKARKKRSTPGTRRAASKPPTKRRQKKQTIRRRILRAMGVVIGKALFLAARSIWEDPAAKPRPDGQSRVRQTMTVVGMKAGKALLLVVLILAIGIRINTRPMPAAAIPASISQAIAQIVPPPPVGQCDLRDSVSSTTAFEADVWNRVRSWCGYIIPSAAANQLDPYLIAAVMWIESHGNPQSYSQSGAVGLMQVMPNDGVAATFRNALGQPYFSDRPTSEQLFDPAFNIYYGATLLAQDIARTGSLRSGLSAYGPENVGYTYADAVLTLYQRLRS